MNFFDKNGYFAVNLTCIATLTYFRRFLTLVFVYELSSSKSMYHICTTAVVIRVKGGIGEISPTASLPKNGFN